MRKHLAVLFFVTLAAILAVGCTAAISPAATTSITSTGTATSAAASPTSSSAVSTTTTQSAPTPISSAEGANFNFLISDEVNAIENFEHLYVTISSIGVQQGGESGTWLQFSPDVEIVDLRPLVGENALSIWSGDIPAGEYTKVFIYISEVEGVLVGAAEGETVAVKLPSNKLQISKPFVVGEDQVTSFVYDLTVIAAGNEKSGVNYILKPQITQSGSDQEFKELKSEEKPQKNRHGLQLSIEGEAAPGAGVSLLVMVEGTPAEGASVTLNGGNAGITGTDGRLNLVLPDTEGEIEIKATLGDREGELELHVEAEEPEEPQEFEGTIEAIEGTIWMVLIGDETKTVDVSSAEIKGDPSIGAKAEVEGIVVEDLILASKVEMEKAKEEKPEEIEFEGTIEAIEGTIWMVLIGNETKTVDVSQAETEGTPAVGIEIEIKGMLVDDVIVASNVMAEG